MTLLSEQTVKSQSDYRTRLNASIECAHFLLHQELPFRGHDECECSSNQGNYLELLHFLSRNNEAIKRVTFSEAPRHNKLTSPDIQKDITQAAAEEITNVIIKDLGDSFFSILIDESRDISIKEQMVVVLRYVDNNGHIIEHFLGIQHVRDTTASSLKAAIEALFSEHGLSISKLRGQGYDGASNMRGEFNGLKSLILNSNPSAYYVHCFAHRLQLTLVAVTKKHNEVGDVFNFISSIINIVGASCKRMEVIREKQYARNIKGLENGEISSGRGLNQETSLRRYGDTRWGSHYVTIIHLLVMFSSVLDVLEIIREDGMNSEQRTEAVVLTDIMESFNFVFMLHCLRRILAVTNEFSQALQRKDQDIENAMSLLKTSKEQFKMMRENDWESLLEEVSSFCIKHDIDILNMDDEYKFRGRSRVTSGFGASLSGDAYKALKTGIEVKDPEEKVKEPLIEIKRVLKTYNTNMVTKDISTYPPHNPLEVGATDELATTGRPILLADFNLHSRGGWHHNTNQHSSNLGSDCHGLNGSSTSDWREDTDANQHVTHDLVTLTGSKPYLGNDHLHVGDGKQRIVAHSSIEADYKALADDIDECDNLNAIYLSVNLIFHAYTKHVEVDYHFIRDRVAKKDI
eukprot:XP_024461449.1 zinc finger MYM-type protein 1 [Populus trichocarpa]